VRPGDDSVRMAAARVRAVRGPVAQTALAAGVAWWVAHDVLGHAQPFFAPIAAAVALSTSHVQRSWRTVQMVVGVLLGIGVAELLRPLVGSGAVSIGVVVAVTLLAAVALGVGFVGEGMMFVNQAAAAAVLVIALHRAGTAGERASDALIGGAVALVVGVGMFPVDPLKVLWGAEASVLGALRDVIERRSPRASGDDPMGMMDGSMGEAGWLLAASHEVHARLTALTLARGTARTSVRVAPRRMRMRARVEEEERRVSRTYLLASSVLSLARTMMDVGELDAAADGACDGGLEELARSIGELERTPRPWPADTLERVGASLRLLQARELPHGSPGGASLTTAIRRAADDVLRLLPDAPASG
jgi:uncharacterized membrane protein YgaE (UPF0421/DUF939 family)